MKTSARVLGLTALAYGLFSFPLGSDMIALGMLHPALGSRWAASIPVLSKAAYLAAGIAVAVQTRWGLGFLMATAGASGVVALAASFVKLPSVLGREEALASLLFLLFGVLPHGLLFGFALALRRTERSVGERSCSASPIKSAFERPTTEARRSRFLAVSVVALVAMGLLIPPTTGLIVRARLQGSGQSVLEWSEILSAGFLTAMLIMNVWATTPFGALALLTWFWVGRAPNVAQLRVRGTATVGGFLAAALADVAGYMEMWRTSDIVVGVAIPMMVFPAGVLGLCAGWVIGTGASKFRGAQRSRP